jgi:hypothetical protein
MDEIKIPDEFKKVMKDFYRDILTSFPEYKDKIGDNEIDFLQDKNDGLILFEYCKKVYPERFFDILYKNTDMFMDDDTNTKFLPNIEFQDIWKEEISDNTKDIIWKYLQLILFSITGEMNSSESFGDTSKLFEAINEGELKEKLEETMKEMNNMFKDMSGNIDLSGMNMDEIPNPDEMHEHINGLLGGKLGRLAHEIAEETAKDLDVDMDSADNISDVFQSLFKNPGKLMNMVKKVGSKLDSKIKSGEIKESELMEEASELMEKMKKMPGMGSMDKILEKMGLPMNGKGGGKMNMGAFQSHMKQNIGKAKQKERMLRKLEERRKMREKETTYTTVTWGDNNNIEKTDRNAIIKKKKKKKKKKNRKKKN